MYLSFIANSYGQAPPSCDQVINKCVNGFCELQTNQQLGCTCFGGYIKDPGNPLVCHPIPPCNLMPGSPDQQCLNGWCHMQSNGIFGCLCNQGFQLSGSNPNMCENIDECSVGYTDCAPGACTDLPGDFTCQACNPGYTLTSYGKCQPFQYGNSDVPQRWRQSNPWLLAWLWDSMIF
ncbi:latent transforming growth factor beta binding protein 2 [Plakobranchus ocellatus]|uniref:Latent transforming growth factor beta binding protein 2 n=1 Tax=Plakobranchus ocellatus TaxID=259542 RepID=A0AAV4D191_9GAST|nr:latent transforming growth factor beta binding protein 2 [Plakobranchus ocellatus]